MGSLGKTRQRPPAVVTPGQALRMLVADARRGAVPLTALLPRADEYLDALQVVWGIRCDDPRSPA